MKKRRAATGAGLDHESVSFTTYAEARRAVDEMVAAHGIPRRAVAIRPVGMRIAPERIVGTANEVVAGWIVVGTLVGAFLGVAFGLVNATSGVIARPWVVLVTLVVIGVAVGAMSGVIAGTVAARRVTRQAEDPLYRASRYTLVVDVSEPVHRSNNRQAAGGRR